MRCRAPAHLYTSMRTIRGECTGGGGSLLTIAAARVKRDRHSIAAPPAPTF